MNIFAILAFSAIVESLISYFAPERFKAHKAYIAAVLGVIVALVYRLDLIAGIMDIIGTSERYAEVLASAPFVIWVSYILTGLFVSRGANVINDIIARIRGDQKPATSSVSVDKAGTVNVTQPAPAPAVDPLAPDVIQV